MADDRLAMAEPMITPRIEKLALLLWGKLHYGAPDLYAQLLQPRHVSGSKAVLARSTATGVAKTMPAVLSFVWKWRTQEDSNLWPLPSEGNALSS